MQSDKESSFFLHPPCLRIQSCHLKKDSYSFFSKALPFLYFYIALWLYAYSLFCYTTNVKHVLHNREAVVPQLWST